MRFYFINTQRKILLLYDLISSDLPIPKEIIFPGIEEPQFVRDVDLTGFYNKRFICETLTDIAVYWEV